MQENEGQPSAPVPNHRGGHVEKGCRRPERRNALVDLVDQAFDNEAFGQLMLVARDNLAAQVERSQVKVGQPAPWCLHGNTLEPRAAVW